MGRAGARRQENFDPRKIAKYLDKDVASLMNDPGIIRNRQKIDATINNAKRFLEIQKEFGSFAAYMWRFTDGKTIKNHIFFVYPRLKPWVCEKMGSRRRPKLPPSGGMY